MNPIKEKWQRGECAIGAWLAIPSSITAEIVGRVGYDYVCVDLQHGMSDYSDALGMFAAIELDDSVPFARSPWNEPGIIGRLLDGGALGVIIPMVNNRDDALAAAAACRYAPRGARSFGPTRVSLGRPSYPKEADETVLCITMIETAEAVANIDEILSVPGIDAAYIGPSDLSVSLGLPPGPHNEEKSFRDALEAVLKTCRRRGVIPGIHTNSKLAQRRLEEGFQLMTVSADLPLFRAAMEGDLAAARQEA